ncbi:MAG: tRNA (guanosine(37)-N1)-methyltransferase TrmD [Proteobacteria bacterium]|nr:tRNA (guanosine(37)-N1)-methyltransferase TrmD [Pseudomonadota bacterium]
MLFDVITIFPGMFEALRFGVVGKALERGLIELRAVDLRDFTFDKHRTTDDRPYGGGDGMVMKVEPVAAALAALAGGPSARKILLTPQGRPFDQALAAELAEQGRLILVCGRYEGVDERIRSYVDDELSLGDFVLSGGEVAAMALIEAVARLCPGVLGAAGAAGADSFSGSLLEHPHYTRPPEFEGRRVPPVLVSGDHAAVARWRREQSLRRTLERRPDLLDQAELGPADVEFLAAHGWGPPGRRRDHGD